MSREDVVAIAVRLFAIYLFLTGLGALVRGIGLRFSAAWGAESGEGSLLVIVAIPIVFVALAAVLWTFPLSVARRLLPVMREPRPALPGSPAELQTVVFSAVGLWLLATALGDAAYWLTYAVAIQRANVENLSLTPEQIASVWMNAVQIAIAVALLLGVNGLQRALQKLRGR